MKGLDEIKGLRASIRSGRLGPGARVGTEAAFAQQWGLARNTVRRAVDTLIQEGLLERRPGKGLYVRWPSKITRAVQVIVPNVAWDHSLQIARGAQQMAAQAGIQIQIYDAHGRMELDLEVIRRLPDRRMNGAIIISLHHQRFSEVLFELKAAKFPFVLVDQRLQDLDVPTVEIENYRGGYLAGRKLAEAGHQRVAFLAPMSLKVIHDRLEGFRDAMLDARVLYDRSLIVDLGGEGLTDFLTDRVDASMDIILDLLRRADRPTAVFDASGDVAPQVYRAARLAGLRIPDDLSVVTFEHCARFGLLEPEIAGLRHPWREAGKAALQMLIGQMDRKGAPPRGGYEHRVMKVEWVPGRSLAAPPGAGVAVPRATGCRPERQDESAANEVEKARPPGRG
ncbi:MAG: GntR family transcriptional regulator [Phycisphaerae bacterium]|jgi:DNA-binding LacI/PurR family transcriptional regulator